MEFAGYITRNRTRHNTPPPPVRKPNKWYGIKVRTWEIDDPENERYLWIYHPTGFTDWGEMFNAIIHALAQYGIELA